VKFALLVKNIWFFFFCRVKFALLVKNTWFFFFCRAKFALICEKYMVPFFLQSEIRIVSHEFCRIIPTVFKITKYSLRILQNFFTRVGHTHHCLGGYLKIKRSRFDIPNIENPWSKVKQNHNLYPKMVGLICLLLIRMGLGWIFLTQVRSGNILAARIGSSRVSFLWVRKMFLKKANFFNFYLCGTKKSLQVGL